MDAGRLQGTPPLYAQSFARNERQLIQPIQTMMCQNIVSSRQNQTKKLMMKRFHTFMMAALTLPMTMAAQGWPADYGGVMLQGFYWDGFKDTKWTRLERQAADFSGYFDLVWVPQSGKTQGGLSMGYDPY